MGRIKCKCGCGLFASERSKLGFVVGHHMRLSSHKKRVSKLLDIYKHKAMPKKTIEKISQTMLTKGIGKNELNNGWKGDAVKYNALHTWIHRNFGKANDFIKG